MLVIGEKYKDGWGVESTVGGIVKNHPEWVWTVQGNWYRQFDGRWVAYLPIDKSRPDGMRRHVAAEKASNWDLVIEKKGVTA